MLLTALFVKLGNPLTLDPFSATLACDPQLSYPFHLIFLEKHNVVGLTSSKLNKLAIFAINQGEINIFVTGRVLGEYTPTIVDGDAPQVTSTISFAFISAASTDTNSLPPCGCSLRHPCCLL
ncbi:hypothetical protein VNO78_18603 [Psophocarpus tetragonolobus]|uniref:Uncharacterized protein n=1 Tax=Psophocarpus tetragonolobus TaxID=3891 RepID=A0AAN9SK61_PSOTE